MKDFIFYQRLRDYIACGVFHPNLSRAERKEMRRTSSNFTVKDGRLFYTGPKQQYMRMVVLDEEEKMSVLLECHDNPQTGKHRGVRGTRDRVIAGYFWTTQNQDVVDWVRCCYHCQLNGPVRKAAPVVRPIKVKDPWDVVRLDLIGPLQETPRGNKYVMTLTDLCTKWVTADPLTCKAANDVAGALINKMHTFGLVRKIITDQGSELIEQLNDKIFEILKIEQPVSSHPQTSRKEKRTSIKRTLKKCLNETQDDWDLRLPAFVYGINSTMQASTGHTPYFSMFRRHPRSPEEINACPIGGTFEAGDSEQDEDTVVTKEDVLDEKVLHNTENVPARQQKPRQTSKRKAVQVYTISHSDGVMISENSPAPLQKALSTSHQGPMTVGSIATQGAVTLLKDNGKRQRLSLSLLSPYYILKSVTSEHIVKSVKRSVLQDHDYTSAKDNAQKQNLDPTQNEDCGDASTNLWKTCANCGHVYCDHTEKHQCGPPG